MAVSRGSEDPEHPAIGKPASGRPSKGRVNDLNGHAGNSTPAPHVNWLNMRGPVGDALDIADLTALELKHRHGTWGNVEKLRQKPGDEQAYLAETAPQLGVRLSRLLDGVKKLTVSGNPKRRQIPRCNWLFRRLCECSRIPDSLRLPRSCEGRKCPSGRTMHLGRIRSCGYNPAHSGLLGYRTGCRLGCRHVHPK